MASFRFENTLREVVETLAPIQRGAGSEGELRAAAWIAARLQRAGARNARVENVDFYDGYARTLLPLAVAGVASGLLASGTRPSLRRRAVAVTAAGAASVLIVDDVSNGWRLWRRKIQPPKVTCNVVAEAGDARATRTLIILAHHDAAPTGAIFDQRAHHWVAKRAPWLIARINTSLPMWWPIVAAPALVATGATLNQRWLTRIGTALGVGVTAVGADIARHRIVPGANDNLSAVAAIVAAAEELATDPVSGIRVMLVSVGAEEVLQGGIYAFCEKHLRSLDPHRTWVLNLDTIGSPELILVEGEGQFWMQDYCSPAFRDTIAATAARTVGPLRRGTRSRGSTDAVITSRAGYPTALLSSWDEHRALSNYHLMTDTPDRLHYRTIARAVRLAVATARELADPSEVTRTSETSSFH